MSILRLILTHSLKSKHYRTAFLGFGWCWLNTMVVWVSCCVCKRRRPGQGSANSNSMNQQKDWDDDIIRATVCGTLASVVCVADGANVGERGGASYIHQVVGSPQSEASISRTCVKLCVERSSALRYIHAHLTLTSFDSCAPPLPRSCADSQPMATNFPSLRRSHHGRAAPEGQWWPELTVTE